MKFDGLVISDDLQMKSITTNYSQKEVLRLTLNAGVDLLHFAQQFQTDDFKSIHQNIMEIVKKGLVSRERVEQAADRIVKFSSSVSIDLTK